MYKCISMYMLIWQSTGGECVDLEAMTGTKGIKHLSSAHAWFQVLCFYLQIITQIHLI